MGYSKVIFGERTLVDLTADTVSPEKMAAGVTAHDSSGEKIIGTLPENSAAAAVLDVENTAYTIPAGIHDGTGTVKIRTQIKSVVSSAYAQTVTPDRGYLLAGVEVKPHGAGGTQLEYIETAGKTYIDTEIKPNWSTRVVMEVELTSGGNNQFFFGSRGSTGTLNFGFLHAIGAFRSDYGESKVSMNYSLVTDRIVIDKNQNVCSVNGTVSANNASGVFQCLHNLYLMASNDAGTAMYHAKGRIYSCKIYDNGTLVRDYIPYSMAGVKGLFDVLNDKFYPLLGADGGEDSGISFTGTVTTTTSGEITIDTGVSLSENDMFFLMPDASNAAGQVFGGSAFMAFAVRTAQDSQKIAVHENGLCFIAGSLITYSDRNVTVHADMYSIAGGITWRWLLRRG